jgi:hypothetical protein
MPVWRRGVVSVAAMVLAWTVVSLLVILAHTGFDWQIGPLSIRVHNLARALRTSALAAAVLLVFSRRARAFARGVPGSALAFYAGALLVAFWLSLGPIITSKGVRLARDGLYWWFYQHVPGFDGLRVPARMGMLVVLFLAVLGGYGARAIERAFRGAEGDRGAKVPRPRSSGGEGRSLRSLRSGGASAPPIAWPPGRATIVLAFAGMLFLIEVSPAPIELNGTWSAEGLTPPPTRLIGPGGPPAIYREVRALPARAVIAEFPFGDEQYDLRYMLHSAAHWRPLLNGYSGGFPPSYAVNRAGLGRVLDDPASAWRVLAASGATHAIVHEDIFLKGDGARVSAWLASHGAREVAAFGADRLFELPPPRVAWFCPPLHGM